MKKRFLVILALITLSLVITPKVHAYDTGREVYVRHIDKATGNIIPGLENATQEVIDLEGNSSLMSRQTSTDATIPYSEFYNIDVSSTMEVTKSLVIKVNARTYSYQGFNMCTRYDLDDADAIMKQRADAYRAATGTLDVSYDGSSSKSKCEIKPSDSNDVTIIDFFYTANEIEQIKPTLLSETDVWKGTKDASLSNITYVPAGGKVLPYFETPNYILKDLSYQKIIADGKVKYQVNNFQVYKVDGTYVKSSDTINKNGRYISGHLVGNTRDTVFTGLTDDTPINIDVTEEYKQNVNNQLQTKLAESTLDNIPTTSDVNKYTANDTELSDFVDNKYSVEYNKLNGLRSAKGNVKYVSYDVLSGYTGGGFEVESTNEHFINVYTPVELDTPEIEVTSDAGTNHTNSTSSSVILADDASFTIKVRCKDTSFLQYNAIDEKVKARFVDYYYFMFDFDIVYNGTTYEKGTIVRLTNTGAFYDGYTYFHAQVAPNETLSRDASNHRIVVFAQASNMPSDDLLEFVADQEEAIQVKKEDRERLYIKDTGTNQVSFTNDVDNAQSFNGDTYTGATLYGDAYYFAMKTLTVRTVSRIYDFKISDCTDLAYRNVFRNISSATDVNSLTGNNYYSGTRRLFVYTSNNKEFTTLLGRDGIYINGSSSTMTLPLGPYKHTTASYAGAPKLGYRIAFNLKTTGYYQAGGNESSSRSIVIKPTYYYISKDGSTIIDDITLYYKDQTGRYKNFAGSNYTIYFTPNDGYRYKMNADASNISSMSTKEVPLNLGSSTGEFYLKDNMMSSDDSGYIQIWYGEFKLPNTTIAVKNGDSVDKPLKDGYLAVKFNITCSDLNLNETISYNKSNQSVANKTNTTQWDYEGYLGFANPGQPVTADTSLRIQLEKGIWSINTQDMYKFVKGTVLLYDIDSRAADDIQ